MKGDEPEGVERERTRRERTRESGLPGDRAGVRGSRRDCGVAGVVSESRVQPSGSYEYII